MRISLALGSGGARGYAHIGALDVLRARGHEVVAIAGTSMGALIGGLAAVGRVEAFADWVTGLTQRDVWRLLDPALTGPGVIWGERVMGHVADILDGARIEDAPIPFTAVATDLTQGREVWFRRGEMAMAIRASIGIPSIFTPIVVNGRLLADGGVLNPVPVDALLGTPSDATIAISLSGSRPPRRGDTTERSRRPVTEDAEPEGRLEEITETIRRGLAESDSARAVRHWVQGHLPGAGERPGETLEPAADAQARDPHNDDLVRGKLPRGLRTTDVAELALETAEQLITRFRMAASPPDVMIELPRDMAMAFDFHRASELIARGREATDRALTEAGL